MVVFSCCAAGGVGAIVVGATVVGPTVVGAAVVGAAVVVALERVTATAYEVDDAPEIALTANEIFSVAPAATESVSVSDEIAKVPKEFVRLISEPEALAIAVKVTDADEFGIVSE